jgi:type IV secretion system protein VirD4
MQSDSAVTLYIVTQPIDKDRLKPLIRVLINIIVRINASGLSFSGGMPKAHYKQRLLLMLDEFPALGKLDILKESLAFLAGYGIKAYLICQDINQLHTHYTRDEAITSNCHVQCAFPPNRIETAEHLSKLIGQTTVVKEQITTSGRTGAGERFAIDPRSIEAIAHCRRGYAHEGPTQRRKWHDHRSR